MDELNVNVDDVGKKNAVSMDGDSQISKDLPFLVTHWLANYRSSSDNATESSSETTQTMEYRKAMAKIRQATSDLASAFTTLGAFGTSSRSSLESSSSYLRPPVFQNRTFSDLNRMHSELNPNHLERLAQAVAFNNITADNTAINDAHTNYIIKANSTRELLRNKESMTDSNNNKVGGKSIQEAIILDSADDDDDERKSRVKVDLGQFSILQNPTLIDSITNTQQNQSLITRGVLSGNNSNVSLIDDNKNEIQAEAEHDSDHPPRIQVQAIHWNVAHQAAQTMREFLTLREKVRSADNEICSLEASMAFQQDITNEMSKAINDIGNNVLLTATEKFEQIEQFKNKQQECGRVICQLQRKISELIKHKNSRTLELNHLETEAKALDDNRRVIVQAFRDPFTSWKGKLAQGSRVGGCITLQSIVGRQQGLSRGRLACYKTRSNLSTGQNPAAHFLHLRKHLLSTRLSHAVTINTHMNYPVYCIRFDRTGRYFITGADDFLIKVFYIGAARSCQTMNINNKGRQLRCNYGANFRGAVLVCTLRGHAGVINDIEVSSDNCMLATASDDGDVRIWGLKNGSPIAILRGHKGGANMVSWSTLTPYRLVSIGSDGFARVWDIREASLKRYSSMVSRRQDYNIRLTEEEKKVQIYRQKNVGSIEATEMSQRKLLLPGTDINDAIVSTPVRLESPPLPFSDTAVQRNTTEGVSETATSLHVDRIFENNDSSNNETNTNNISDAGIIVPPLPAAVPPLGVGVERGNEEPAGEDENAPGQFVANDLIDEGVKLLSKYQHGAMQEEHHGPGTRSRRSAINVICVARCPLGKQFVTGSDDGICRVWEDFDDNGVAIVDGRRRNKTNKEVLIDYTMPPRSGIKDKPLIKLMGHVSTITDLSYSHAGDRILSASQKDGVVRLWNIGIATPAGNGNKTVFKQKRVTQIVIKLTNPFTKKPSQPARRRPGSAARNASSKVCCDVAVWTHDDAYVITSQSVLIKENAKPIQPGSQFLCLWHSKSGQCLISISGAHTMNCQVVIPHPMDASIFCTGSIDGTVKIWDLSYGKCMLTHRNKVEFGPPDQNKPNYAGYLDGSFSPDGNSIVLTDECGQITVLDSISKEDNLHNSGHALKWMREQYFANDYYDLAYDRNGYCIERGSERPPHLAPKSARSTHNGTPYSDEINETYKKLIGPSPLPEISVRWHREQIRAKLLSRYQSAPLSPDHEPPVRNIVREFDPLSTIVIRGVNHTGNSADSSNDQRRNTSTFGSAGYSPGGNMSGSASSTNTGRLESARYRYLDYEDLIRREGNPEEDEPDSDDEEFEPTAPRRSSRGATNSDVDLHDDDEDEDDDEVMDSFDGNPGYDRRSSRQRNEASIRTTDERRVRAQRRTQRNNSSDFVEIGSDDEMIAQFVSINKTATGPYLKDYTLNGHYWRFKSRPDAARVRRKWLQRKDSESSYFGRKAFTPQMGDSVVYIPRAHFETIKECPSLSPPWQNWPRESCWPVVRCFVRGIRYRFPYEDYFRNKQQVKCSSIVAILTLELTGIPELSNGEFPWPKPSFIQPTRPFVFELSVFENTSCEYVISEMLYTSRISSLENHIRSRNGCMSGLEVDLYYEQARTGEDLELQAWPATIEEIFQDIYHPDLHLQGSGYGVVQVWDGAEENRDSVSPWELNTDGVDLARPCLSEEENNAVLQEINRLLRNDDIAHHFSMPVDGERYCDYAMMVEIPMDLMTVKRRLATNYYGSRLAVAADLRLIRDNCIKYNTTEHETSEIASTMCNEFEANVLSENERSQIISEEDFDKIHSEQSQGRQTSRMRIQLSARRVEQASEAAASSSGGRYTLRNRGRSALENLPAPDNNTLTQRRYSGRAVDNAIHVNRDIQHNRSHRRDNETEVLGQMSGLLSSSSRRGISRAIDVHGGNGRASRTVAHPQRNENSLGTSRRSSRRPPLPEIQDNPNRRSSRIQNNRPQPQHPSEYSDDNNNSSEDETENREVSFRTARRTHSSRESDSDHSQEFNAGGNTEETTSSNNARRSTRRTSCQAINLQENQCEDEITIDRVPRLNRRTSRRTLDEDIVDNSDEEIEQSDAESQYSDDNMENSSSGESDFEDCESQPTAPTKRSRTIARSSESPPERRSNRRTSTERKTYEEIESDEEQYIDESEDSNDVGARLTSNRKSGRNCNQSSSRNIYESEEEIDEENSEGYRENALSPIRNTRKRKVVSKSTTKKSPPQKKKAKQDSVNLPELRPWPDIDVSDITMVVNEILRRISDTDELEMFANPVAEAHPAISDAYLSVIETPMDLRTIEEDRIHYYNSIQMLQDDLVLMFNNCCKFNAPNTEFWIIAKVLWEDLNQIFFETCNALGVLIPRRWNP